MPIGTDLGAHFEDEFDHQAGVEYGRKVDVMMPSQALTEPRDALKSSKGTSVPEKQSTQEFDLPRAPFGVTGPAELPEGSLQGKVLQRQLGDTFNPAAWIQKAAKAIHAVGAGQVPMWAMDPETGEFHTSPEGLEKGVNLAPLAISGAIPTTIHIRGEAHEALQEGPDVFQQFMANRGRRQPRNIENLSHGEQRAELDNLGTFEPLIVPATGRPSTHFEHNPVTNEYRQIPFITDEAAEAEARRFSRQIGEDWDRVSPSAQERYINSARFQLEEEHQYRNTEADLIPGNTWQELREHRIAQKQRDLKIDQDLLASDKAIKQGNVTVVKDETSDLAPSGRNSFRFVFKNEADKIGEIEGRLRDEGKHIRIQGMYGLHGASVNDIGHGEVTNLVRFLKNHFERAEEISGFRVSGARSAPGSQGRAEAVMRIRPKQSGPERKSIEDLTREWGDTLQEPHNPE
jgi:hypothetical protein